MPEKIVVTDLKKGDKIKIYSGLNLSNGIFREKVFLVEDAAQGLVREISHIFHKKSFRLLKGLLILGGASIREGYKKHVVCLGDELVVTNLQNYSLVWDRYDIQKIELT